MLDEWKPSNRRFGRISGAEGTGAFSKLHPCDESCEFILLPINRNQQVVIKTAPYHSFVFESVFD